MEFTSQICILLTLFTYSLLRKIDIFSDMIINPPILKSAQRHQFSSWYCDNTNFTAITNKYRSVGPDLI